MICHHCAEPIRMMTRREELARGFRRLTDPHGKASCFSSPTGYHIPEAETKPDPRLSVECRRCAVGVPIAVASRTGGYCEACQPTLPGMASDVAAQDASAAEVSGAELADQMRQLGRSISADAGEMERKSPLFFGTGDNPGLF